MLVQAPILPTPLAKVASTAVLASERPAGFTRVRISRLPADARLHTLGAVRIDFSNRHASQSASYALMRTSAAATQLARTEASVKPGGLFFVRATAIGRFAVAVTAQTAAGARTMLALALVHLRRSER